MTRSTNPRRLRALLALAIGAVALLSVAGFATAKDGNGRRSDDSPKRHSHQPTGTIAAFDAASGKLTIALTGGDEFSGLVTKRTKIRCEDERSHDSRSRARESGRGHDGNDDRGDDNSGNGSGGRGSDDSGQSGNDDNGRGANCTRADLVAGAVVDEAELELRRGKAIWDEIELDD